MSSTDTLRPILDRIQQRALAIGVVALVVSVGWAFANPDQFFRSYFLACIFWLEVALGSIALLMLQHLTGGQWGLVIRRILEAGTRTIPLMAVLMVPILFRLKQFYTWTDPQMVSLDPVLKHKSLYLNTPFFLARLVFYFAVWFLLVYLLNKWSWEQDETREPRIKRRFEALSGPGLVFYGLTITFASIDWVMSLEPHWFSTIYGLIFMVGQVLLTLSFVIAVLMLLAQHKPLSDVIRPSHFHDLGKLLLTFVMLWAYVSFSQFLIIWSGNLPEETPWFLRRMTGGWQYLAILVILFHFALPFLLLLSRGFKRDMSRLAKLAVAMILVRWATIYWMVAPGFAQGVSDTGAGSHFTLHAMDVLASIGIGGIWMAVFIWQLKGRPLLPAGDPSVAAMLEQPAGH
jgi:hypothetical protein